jgi:hypothetical protein
MRSNVHQGHVARKRFGQNFLVDDGIITASSARSTRSRTTSWSRSARASAR